MPVAPLSLVFWPGTLMLALHLRWPWVDSVLDQHPRQTPDIVRRIFVSQATSRALACASICFAAASFTLRVTGSISGADLPPDADTIGSANAGPLKASVAERKTARGIVKGPSEAASLRLTAIQVPAAYRKLDLCGATSRGNRTALG